MYYYIFSGQILKSCLCFDPSAPVDNRISQIANMNYVRENHSLIVANGKLYAIGGWVKILYTLILNVCWIRYQKTRDEAFCNSIEEYNPQTDEWRIVDVN